MIGRECKITAIHAESVNYRQLVYSIVHILSHMVSQLYLQQTLHR